MTKSFIPVLATARKRAVTGRRARLTPALELSSSQWDLAGTSATCPGSPAQTNESRGAAVQAWPRHLFFRDTQGSK